MTGRLERLQTSPEQQLSSRTEPEPLRKFLQKYHARDEQRIARPASIKFEYFGDLDDSSQLRS